MKYLIVLISLIALPVYSQKFYVNNNYKHFYEDVQREAEKGNVVAIKELGDIYNWGNQYMSTYSGSVDYQKAMEQYLLAADFGYPYAQLEIAHMYSIGKGVESDKEKSLEWRDKALTNFIVYAENGDSVAMERLTEYYGGYEDSKYTDYVKAFYWAFRALEAGYPFVASNIASLYEYGNGVEKNISYAYVWKARYCIEAKKRNWPVEAYPAYKDLSAAGFSTSSWETLASCTYGIDIQHLPAEDGEGIKNAVETSLNYLAKKNDEILAAVGLSRSSSDEKSDSQTADAVKELFEVAYNTSDSEPQTKYNRYMHVIQADPYNKAGYKAVAYNNIGVLYETLGDLKNAKTCYEYALQTSPNYAKAKENLKSIKAKQRSQRWSNIGNALGAFGQTLGTMNGAQSGGTYNPPQGNGGSYGGSSSGGSTGSSTCKRCQGSGKCSSMSGTANKYYCHGSGKCGYCNGSGIVRNLGQTLTCTSCNGRGRCKYCNGSGKCSDCGGSGKR